MSLGQWLKPTSKDTSESLETLLFICVIDIPFKCSPWNEKGVAPEGDGLNLKRISLAVNEVTPDSKLSSKSELWTLYRFCKPNDA